ncbi:MAG: hypothetical protein ACOH2K_10940 [Burkholderiaceae bacterium]
MMIRKYMLGLGSALILSMLVAGCGGDDNGSPFDRSGKYNTAEPVAAQDGFVDAVKTIVATTSDTTEPVSIDAITPTSPSNTAPVPIS